MDFWHKLIDECDIVCFSRLLEVVTSGVGDEVNYTIEKKKKVYEICCSPNSNCFKHTEASTL